MKKVLVLGASGAMGQYLVPLLSEFGYQVDAVSLDKVENSDTNVRRIQTNCKDLKVLDSLLANHYDGIVDFMIYNTANLFIYLPILTSMTDHYIYLSSYRVYDGQEVPIRETSPLLLDSTDNIRLRYSDDYCIYKARGEKILTSFERKNWTIIRPAITYSYLRYQLVTLEAPLTVNRAFAGKKVVLPEVARNVQATMSWGGDVARMISKLLFNPKAIGKDFSVTTSEHHTWGEIADYYKDICNLQALWVDKEDYLSILEPERRIPGVRWQLEYDRLFNRTMDNSKVLAATGITQSELTTLYDGLKHEVSRYPKDYQWTTFGQHANERMDDYIKKHKEC